MPAGVKRKVHTVTRRPSLALKVKRRVRRAMRKSRLIESAWQRYVVSRRVPDISNTTPQAPAKLVDFGPATAMITTTRWLDKTKLEVGGWVFSQGIMSRPDCRPRLRIWVQGEKTGRRVNAVVTQLIDPEVNVAAQCPNQDYSGAAFSAVCDVDALRSDRPASERWQFRYQMRLRQAAIHGSFSSRMTDGSAGHFSASQVSATVWAQPSWRAKDGLAIEFVGGPETVDPPGQPTALISTFSLVDGPPPQVHVDGTLTGAPKTQVDFDLRGPQGVIGALSVHWDGDKFSTTIPLVVSHWGGRPAPLAHGIYDLWITTASGDSLVAKLSAACIQSLPHELKTNLLTARLVRTGDDKPQVRMKPPMKPEELGKYAQTVLERAYSKTQLVPDGSVYFENPSAKSASDSPRAIHDELVRRGSTRKLYWAVTDFSVQVPEGGTALLWRSREWWEVLARASYFVHSGGPPGPLRERPDQVLVQTWHGTPFKLLGYDRPVNRENPGFAERMAKSSARWRYMIAGNPYSADIFRKAYFYQGTMLELGYPRNDSLITATAEDVVNIKRRLSIGPEQKVVLYAPTWRDGDPSIVGYLDAGQMGHALGPEYLVLVRGHQHTLRSAKRVVGAQVLDVTSYPLINELFLVADVAITDYSSIMFDFSVTGKPLLFFVPDLDDYRDRRRGAYFDLGETAPGPLLSTQTEVVDALRSIDEIEERYGERYKAWQEKFNPNDDGHAASRVVDAIFGVDF